MKSAILILKCTQHCVEGGGLDFKLFQILNDLDFQIYQFSFKLYRISLKSLLFYCIQIFRRLSIKILFFKTRLSILNIFLCIHSRAAVVHLNFRAGSTFPVQFVLHLALWTGLAGATRLTRSDFMLHKGWISFYQRGRFAWPFLLQFWIPNTRIVSMNVSFQFENLI